ncbi:hypothetical protein PTSG_08606 [Salpingoeca rosetta]|uniref:SbsA Ig-like domain-containing protein n=1 Tax=Salpingoeca rosetta (strain ATCC 50818 / BSB-021) TaxID=946362 RepID=F2UK59_SALR5|nr:uncharacterized protein PTSG_08606 [Salpingoeca rosetta]EGD77508.1 hypothetical protein PTSG_08606 [Salpingoeca rosetta]|eukprot:XP_004990396.1 hypothetical protein PTSG_08606 [Salpingoeca rosetta]
MRFALLVVLLLHLLQTLSLHCAEAAPSPQVQWSTGDISGPISVAQDVMLEFDMDIVRGAGVITITDGGSDVHTVAVSDMFHVFVDGNCLTVNLPSDLQPSSTYSVLMDAGAVRDASSNSAFVGVADNTTITFSTGSVIYAGPLAGDGKSSGSGTLADPYQSIGHASMQAGPGDTLYITWDRNSIANNSNRYNLAAVGSAAAPVFIKPAPGVTWPYQFVFANAWRLDGSSHVVIEEFTFDGRGALFSHEEMLCKYVWNSKDAKALLGGIAINLRDATYVRIRSNVFQHLQQKAVNIEDGRYVAIENNIIYDVATKSLSGGHGIMRQQGSGTFGTPDVADTYRWDIRGNLIFNVEQRIYSWVPSKGYLNMVLDEGKPINVDETGDVDMTTRITNNVIAYSGIDAIRLKNTPNLEVSHNSIYSADPLGDGITDRDVSGSFANFTIHHNLIMTAPNTFALELDDTLPNAAHSFGNVVLGGAIKPAELPGVTAVTNSIISSLFVDPAGGNFTRASGVPVLGAGVDDGELLFLMTMARNHNISVHPDDWVADHVRDAQTLIDNMPSTVFTSRGQLGQSALEPHRMALYVGVNATWKQEYGAAASQELVLPEDYCTWLDAAAARYKQANGSDYNWIRHGDSVLALDYAARSGDLSVYVVQTPHTYTQTRKLAQAQSPVHVVLAGDAVIDMRNATGLMSCTAFDLVVADSVSGSYERVVVDGLPTSWTYSVSVVHEQSPLAASAGDTVDVIRLTIESSNDSCSSTSTATTMPSTTTATAATTTTTTTTHNGPGDDAGSGTSAMTSGAIGGLVAGVLVGAGIVIAIAFKHANPARRHSRVRCQTTTAADVPPGTAAASADQHTVIPLQEAQGFVIAHTQEQLSVQPNNHKGD